MASARPTTEFFAVIDVSAGNRGRYHPEQKQSGTSSHTVKAFHPHGVNEQEQHYNIFFYLWGQTSWILFHGLM